MKHMSALVEPPILPEPATVGIRALKQNASAVVARAAAGETLLITDRGRPVARLLPLAPKSRIQEMIDAGQITMPTMSIGDFIAEHTVDGVYVPPIQLPPGSPSILDILLEMREEETN